MDGVFERCIHWGRLLFDDLRLGFRITARDRYSSLLMVGSLGLAIGACALVFSLTDAILFRPLSAVFDPSAMVAIYGDDRSTAKVDYQSIAYPDYLDFKQNVQTFSNLTAYSRFPVTLASGDEARRVSGELVAANYFSLLGVRLTLGRAFESNDDATGALPAAVISHRLWQTAFGGARDVLGKRIRINQLEALVVGVAPPEFGGVLLDWYGRADIWLPLHLQPRLSKMDLLSTRIPWLMCLGRLLPGASLEQARGAVQARAGDLEKTYPDTHRNWGAVLLPADEVRFYPGRRTAVTSVLAFLFAGALILLLIACFNAASLLLARGEKRAPELNVRMALGAQRSHLVAQLVAESLIIAVAADTVGLAFASLATRYLPSVTPMFNLDFEARLDGRVGVALVLTTFLTVLVFGLFPALRISSVSLAPALRSRSGGLGSSLGLRRTVIVCQVSLTVVVLASGVMFLRELRRLQDINPGFAINGIQVIRLDAQAVPANQREALYLQLLHFVRTLPGVHETCLARQEPLSGVVGQTVVRPEAAGVEEKRVACAEVSRDYFRLLQLPIVYGRAFESEINAKEVIVNEVLAAQYWAGENPVGHQLLVEGEQTPYLVVGVTKTSKTIDVAEQPRPFLYLPLGGSSFPEIVLLTRSSLPLPNLVSSVKAKVRQDMRQVALLDSSTLEQVAAARSSVERTLAVWTLSVAALALFLVVTGLVGVLSLFVSQRSREMAIRLAVGASPFDLSRWVISQGLSLSITGVLFGLAIFLGLQGFLSTHLKAAAPSPLTTHLCIAGFVLTICVAACLGPMLRAWRIQPAQALRSE